jgi:hypothetical protein
MLLLIMMYIQVSISKVLGIPNASIEAGGSLHAGQRIRASSRILFNSSRKPLVNKFFDSAGCCQIPRLVVI